jgi:hypothetical protein
MQPQVPEAPAAARVRIYSHVTQSRFLHIEDSLKIGKVRLFGGTYRRGQGMAENGHAAHFLDLADARVIFHALATAEPNFSHKEYKGTPPQARSGAVSRVLSVAVKGDNVYIELKSGPGKLTATGAVMPDGKPQVEVNVGFKLYEARRLGATVLAYIQAWDVMRMLANKHAVSPPITYLLVPTAAEGNGLAPGNGQSPGAKPLTSGANGNGRPPTRHGPTPPPRPATGNGAARRATAVPAPTPSAKQNGGGRDTAVPAPRPPVIGETAVPAPTPSAKQNGGRDTAVSALPAPTTGNTTAVAPTPPDAEAIAQALYSPTEAPPTPPTSPVNEDDPPLRYGDGAAVETGNAVETQTFRRFVAEHKTAPASKSALQAYYRQQQTA